MSYLSFIVLVLSVFVTICKFLQKNLNEPFSVQLIEEEKLADNEHIHDIPFKFIDAETQTDLSELGQVCMNIIYLD